MGRPGQHSTPPSREDGGVLETDGPDQAFCTVIDHSAAPRLVKSVTG
jgi:hypothetical protein